MANDLNMKSQKHVEFLTLHFLLMKMEIVYRVMRLNAVWHGITTELSSSFFIRKNDTFRVNEDNRMTADQANNALRILDQLYLEQIVENESRKQEE